MSTSALRVLQSFPRPRPTTNPYVVMLADSLRAREDVELSLFDWRTALLGRHDVLHVHWPETLVTGSSRVRTLARQLLFGLAVLRWRMTGTAVVATAHNLSPHEGRSRSQRWLLARLNDLVVVRVLLNHDTPVRPGEASLVIPHGHYRDWYDEQSETRAEDARVAVVGLIRAYKRVPDLVCAFRATAGSLARARLHVAGRVPDPAEEARVRAAAAGDPRIELDLAHQSDAAIAAAVRRSSVVVLPYRDLHNSGAALLALSLDRPVLVPENAVTSRLAAEVGAGWVRLFAGDLSPDDLVDAMDAPRPTGRPDLSARDWTDAGERHVAAYRLAVSLRRGRPLDAASPDLNPR